MADLILKELIWIPVGLIVGFMVIIHQKLTKPKRHRQRGYYGGEGYLSSFPDDNTDRPRLNLDHNS